MLTNIAKKIFGSRNDRLLKQYRKSVVKINALEEQMKALSDADLQAKTAEFKQRLADGQTLDDILVEAFAVCREASHRVLGMRHFDVQLIGGMVLHNGKIAEMRTGEGKTLVAPLAVYLNALAGKGVHVDIIKLYGSMELAPLVGLSDAIVDLVSTGNTLKANGLEAVEHVVDISSRLVVNKAALKTKHALLEPIIQAFGSAVKAG